MPKIVLPLLVAMLVMLATLAVAFAVYLGRPGPAAPDARWAVLATQQRRDYDSTRTPVPATAARTVAPSSTPDAPHADATATATPSPTDTPTAPVAATPTPTPLEPTGSLPPLAVTPAVAATPALPVATVAIAALNVRAGPGLAFPVLAVLRQGDGVALTGERGVADEYLWVEVVLADGRRGWTLGEPVGVR